jgi:hypothetical protein
MIKVTDSFFMGNDAGWFCACCPTLVINPEEVQEFLSFSLPHWDVGTEFAVAGIVNVDAVPEEKRSLPLGGDDNPVPLVRFTSVSHQREPAQAPLRHVAPTSEGDTFEKQYEDVLQNIEFSIVRVYYAHPEMTDWQALAAVEALLRAYQAEAKGRQAAPPPPDPLAQEVYTLARVTCEWRLGRGAPFENEQGEPVEVSLKPVTLDEMVACLKRIRKSINRWSREGGRRGYLAFVSQFFPMGEPE